MPIIDSPLQASPIQQILIARKQKAVGAQNALLKKGVWLYFFLLIFEGVLRKWIVPQLSDALLIIRDPIALWITITAWNRGILKTNLYVVVVLLTSIVSFFLTITLGHQNVPVALFGLRILIIHFPFMFAMGNIFNRADVVKLGKITLWIAIPMAGIIVMQFFSPQSAWINLGAGGVAGTNLFGALGYFRPSGTFSYTTGTTSFFSFVAVFVFYFWFDQNSSLNRIFLICATSALAISLPFSISRSLLLGTGFSGLFAIIAASLKPKYLKQALFVAVGAVLLLLVLNQLDFFHTATAALTDRVESASANEGGVQGTLITRYLGGMSGAITNSASIPFFGFGLGIGTNVGSFLMTGAINFLVSEGEWGRLIAEMGLLLGLIIIFIRLFFCVEVTILAFRKLQKGDLLPWMLASNVLLAIPQGQWAQPTSLGFSTLIGGLILASLK